MGGYDIFYSEWQNGGKWTDPKDLVTHNTADDQVSLSLPQTEEGYYSYEQKGRLILTKASYMIFRCRRP